MNEDRTQCERCGRLLRVNRAHLLQITWGYARSPLEPLKVMNMLTCDDCWKAIDTGAPLYRLSPAQLEVMAHGPGDQ